MALIRLGNDQYDFSIPGHGFRPRRTGQAVGHGDGGAVVIRLADASATAARRR